MSNVIVALAVAVLSAPMPGVQWSAEQQEVVDQLKECWDIWTDALEEETPDRWIDACAHPDFSYWWIDAVPGNVETTRLEWPYVRTLGWWWYGLRPVEVKIYDDIAILHFYGYWRQGMSETMEEAKRTEVFMKVDDRWLLLAGHATPLDR